VSRLDVVLKALERGERDARFLDGRDFDANYWSNARRQLTVIGRDLAIEKRLNVALREFVDEEYRSGEASR
jgi:hypothetical protein